MKLHVYSLAIVIYIQCRFHEIPSIGYRVMLRTERRTVGQNDGPTMPNGYLSAFA